MVFIIILFILAIILGGITTIPLPVGLLVLTTVFYRKPWVFFLAFGVGLFLDLISLRALGYSSVILTTFVLLIFLYERKFETRTSKFVFISTLVESLIYLAIFNYQLIFWSALINSLFAVIFFKLWLRLVRPSETI